MPSQRDQIYQHVTIRGGLSGVYIVRFDEDPNTDRIFVRYDSALLHVAGVLAQSRLEDGVKGVQRG